MAFDDSTWRNVTFERHAPGVWVSSDRLWKLTNSNGEPHWIAFIQLDPHLAVVDSAETPARALENVAAKAESYALKLAFALEQTRPIR